MGILASYTSQQLWEMYYCPPRYCELGSCFLIGKKVMQGTILNKMSVVVIWGLE